MAPAPLPIASPAEIDAFYQVAGARRDVRNGFLPAPVDDEDF